MKPGNPRLGKVPTPTKFSSGTLKDEKSKILFLRRGFFYFNTVDNYIFIFNRG
ncbi:hypothetical protein JCM16358_13930 [Halanaerocella petrolearia]